VMSAAHLRLLLFNASQTSDSYTLSLHDALPIFRHLQLAVVAQWPQLLQVVQHAGGWRLVAGPETAQRCCIGLLQWFRAVAQQGGDTPGNGGTGIHPANVRKQLLQPGFQQRKVRTAQYHMAEWP